MKKWFSMFLLGLILTSMSSAWAEGENEAVFALYQEYRATEDLWDQDDPEYGAAALRLAQRLEAFQYHPAFNRSAIQRVNKFRLMEMDFKLAEFFVHQRDPRKKLYGEVISKSVIQYPELSFDRLRLAEKLFGMYLIITQVDLHIDDQLTQLPIQAHYYAGLVRMMVAEYELDHMDTLAGPTQSEKASFVWDLIKKIEFSVLDFDVAKRKSLRHRHSVSISIQEELDYSKGLLQYAQEVLQRVLARPGV